MSQKQSNTPTIITGQQIGLLGGPLYTTYKVLGAIHLAREINGTAIYWLETNDADFNEINHIDYLDAGGQLRTLTWDIDSHGYSCGYIEVDDMLVNLLETFFSTIRKTEFTPALRRIALNCYAKGLTLADASERLAVELFNHFNIRIFTPFDREFRKFTQLMLRKEARRTPEGEQCNCFCLVGKQRKTLFKQGTCYVTREKMPVHLTKSVLLPNVKTRSVCQDAYFHAHTYVAGPGEVKYLPELDPVYEYHGVKKAAVQPRMSVTLVEPKVKRLMQKMEIDLEGIFEYTREELVKEVMEELVGFDFKEALKRAEKLTGELAEKLQATGLESMEIKPLRKALQGELKVAFGKMRAREKAKHEKVLKNIRFLSDSLKPFGKKQDRVFNIFYYMNLYGGKAFINWLYDFYDTDREILEIEHE